MYESIMHVDLRDRSVLSDNEIRPWAKADHVLDEEKNEE